MSLWYGVFELKILATNDYVSESLDMLKVGVFLEAAGGLVVILDQLAAPVLVLASLLGLVTPLPAVVELAAVIVAILPVLVPLEAIGASPWCSLLLSSIPTFGRGACSSSRSLSWVGRFVGISGGAMASGA